jgi:acyl-CoA reductase-like NAD-dependent aldehyde dehydrogenase
MTVSCRPNYKMEPRINPRKALPVGSILKADGRVRIVGFHRLPESSRSKVTELLTVLKCDDQRKVLYDGLDVEFPDDTLPISEIGKAVAYGTLAPEVLAQALEPEKLDVAELLAKAGRFAAFLRRKQREIRDALRHYETYQTVLDEIDRSTEYLINLGRNEQYFQFRAPSIATYMPLNQPLYALVCFGIVPSMMCKDVHLRPPTFVHSILPALLRVLDLESWFPNLHVSYEDKSAFVERTKHTAKGVIFVGSPKNAERVRRCYPSDILFLANGCGHNPIVVGRGANLAAAIDSVMDVTLYNQGQDCCSPNAILVNAAMVDEFTEQLLARLRSMEHLVGPSADDRNIVGPNTDIAHTVKVAEMFVEHAPYHLYGGDINPVTGLIRPSVFLKPIADGANYHEFFAPVFFVQPYRDEGELNSYFFSEHYRKNAMYLTIFGECDSVPKLIQTGLHNRANIIVDSDLHKTEKGYNPYGGLGINASCIYFRGDRRPSSILPEREIYTYLVMRRNLNELTSESRIDF